jgi:O-antigen/teichoic acid export membrane protein
MDPRKLLEGRTNPLPEGTLAVGAGLIVSGITSYGFLAISARALGPEKYAPLGVLWALTYVVCPGVFLPLEQEVGRALSTRRAKGLGGGPLIRRAALAGGVAAAVLIAATAATGPLSASHLFDDKVMLLVALMVALGGYYAEFLVRGVLSGNGRFKSYGVILGSEALLRMLACFALAVVGVDTVGPFGIIIGLAPIAATLIGVRKERNLVTPGPDAPWSELSTALGYLLAGSVMAQLLVNAGVFAVQILADADQRGPGGVAGRFLNGLIIARVPLFMFQAVQAALLPKLAHLAGEGRHDDFRTGLKRLLAVVVGIGSLATVTAFAIGPFVVTTLFGKGFELSHKDLAYLAGASAIYMLALALAQALIALENYSRVVLGWASGLIAFVAVTAIGEELLPRVENGFLAGSIAAAVVMALSVHSLLSKGLGGTHDADELVEASHQLPIEP